MMPVKSGWETDLRTMMPGAICLDRIGSVASIGPLPSTGLPSASTVRPSSALPTGTESSRPVVCDLVAFLELRDVAEHDAADLVLLEIQRDADRATRETGPSRCTSRPRGRRSGDAVGDRADVAGVLLDRLAESLAICCSICSRTVLIGAMGEGGFGLGSDAGRERRELRRDGGFVNVVADADPKPGDQGVVAAADRRDRRAGISWSSRSRSVGAPSRRAVRRARPRPGSAPARRRRGVDRLSGPPRRGPAGGARRTPAHRIRAPARSCRRPGSAETAAGRAVGPVFSRKP